MSDPIQPAPPPVAPAAPPAVVNETPTTPPSAIGRYNKIALWVGFAIGVLNLLLWLLNGQTGAPPALPIIPLQTATADVPPAQVEFAKGWVNNPLAVNEVKLTLPMEERNFRDTAAGKALHGNDGTVLLSDAAKLILGRHLDAENQGQVGCCTGEGTGTAINYLQLNQIAAGDAKEFKKACVEALYGLARFQIGGNRIRGDGATTAWNGQAAKDYGVIGRDKNVGGFDLSMYSESRARAWGDTGLPKVLEPIAKQSPVKGISFANSADDVAKAIRQRYTVAVGSQQGFGERGPYIRDKDGFLAPSGTWGHCQAVIGVRDDNRKGFLFCNSWGADWIKGPTGPHDIPPGCYWVDWNVADRMFREGDCIVFSDAVGFPARQLDWFTSKPIDAAQYFGLLPPVPILPNRSLFDSRFRHLHNLR